MADTVASMRAWLGSLQARLTHTTDQAVEDALDELIGQLRPVTPVWTGRPLSPMHMRDAYTVASGAPGVWELLNTAESPRGYAYPTRVLDDPTWSRQYSALNQVLDAGIAALEADFAASVERVVRAF